MNSKCHKDNYKTRHDKTPRREHKQNALQHKSYQCFLRSISKGNRNKDKNKQMGANQAYKLFYSKGSHNQNEMTWNGRKDLQTVWPIGFNFRSIQTAHTTQQH